MMFTLCLVVLSILTVEDTYRLFSVHMLHIHSLVFSENMSLDGVWRWHPRAAADTRMAEGHSPGDTWLQFKGASTNSIAWAVGSENA